MSKYKVITKRHCGLGRKNGQIDEGTKWRAQKKKNSGNKNMLDL